MDTYNKENKPYASSHKEDSYIRAPSLIPPEPR